MGETKPVAAAGTINYLSSSFQQQIREDVSCPALKWCSELCVTAKIVVLSFSDLGAVGCLVTAFVSYGACDRSASDGSELYGLFRALGGGHFFTCLGSETFEAVAVISMTY